jgi:serine protease AprX
MTPAGCWLRWRASRVRIVSTVEEGAIKESKMRPMRRAWATLVGLVLCVGALPLAASPARGSSGTVFVRLPAAGSYPAAVPAVRAFDYGSFVWLEVDRADLGRLQADQVYEDPFTLRLGEQTFDPLRGVPAQPDGWDAVGGQAPDLHLVQFFGPTRAEWLDGLRKRGLEIVQYIPPFTYVVWGASQALTTARAADAVRWTGDFDPAYRVLPQWRNLPDEPVRVRVLLYRGADTASAIGRIEALGGQAAGRGILNEVFETAAFTISGARLQAAARVPGVYSIQLEPTGGGLRGEMSDQVNVGNYDAGNLAFPGYPAWLSGVGLDGSGVVMANVDSGVDDDHADLAGRFVPCSGLTCGGSASSDHGTHTAGIMAADGSSGVTKAGFLRGLGMAPGANLVEQLYSPFYLDAGGMLRLMTDSYQNGASLSGNSWGPSGTPRGYDDDTMQVDIGVRDADPAAPGNQSLTYVLSIMNGDGGTSTQGTPDEAKNIFTIGSTRMQESDGTQILQIDDLSSNTAHGPALDGRTIPHLVAPGCNVDSTWPDGYGTMCGTSMASPHVSGAVALFIEYYRGLFGLDPSPALVKAAFLPVAHDLAGHLDADGNVLGHPFDSKQGWGRLDAAAVVDPQRPVLYYDHPTVFDDTGEEWLTTVAAVDPGRPVRLMLVWTDAPGHGLGGTTPAWNNDLDLVVEAGGSVYRGNAFGPDGWSQAGGAADGKNNTEGVFLGPSAPGAITVRVVASNITSDGVPHHGDDTDQDWSLVCYNCTAHPDYTLSAVPNAFEICAPGLLTGTLRVGQVLDYAQPVTLTVLGAPAGVVAAASPVTVTPPGESTLTLGVGDVTPGGDYTLVVSGVAETSNVHTAAVGLGVASELPGVPAVVSPFDGAVGLDAGQVALSWELLPQVGDYRLQVDTEPSFASPVADVTGLSGGTYTLDGVLDPATCYFWRVQAGNACGSGEWAGPFHLTTAALPVGSTGVVDLDTEGGTLLPPGPAPAILGITPAGVTSERQAPVIITGVGFLPTPLVLLGSTALLDATYVSSTTLTAVVPAGMVPGTYDLTVINPDCQAATLASAFTVGCSIDPGVTFSSDSPVLLGEAMHFTATVTGTAPLTVSWGFGAPGEGSGWDTLQPVYTYTVSGDFAVCLSVTDACGSSAFTRTVTVEPGYRQFYLPLLRKEWAGR